MYSNNDLTNTLSQLGQTLRNLRRTRKLSQTALGQLAGISRMPVYRLESGRDVSLGSSLALLKALGYTLQVQPIKTKPLHVDDLAKAFAHLQDDDVDGIFDGPS